MTSVAEVIQKHYAEILRLWTEEARKAASARGLAQPEFLNIFPEYLSSLARTGDDDGTNRRELVERHFSTRLRQGFHLAEIVEEFAILGRCISRMWASTPEEEQPTSSDVEELFTDLNLASVATIEMFTRHMSEDEQTDKRYIRLLENVAREVAEENGEALKEQTQALVGLVMEAMGAQTVTLLLYEPESEKLVVAASVGVANEMVERYASSLGPSSFAGQIAANQERPTTMLNAETTELEVSEALRHSGIRSLLGVRLPSRQKLLGVLYVGITEQRSFSPREIRRFEMLGDRLTLHLENTRLYTDLRNTIRALREERDLRERFVSLLTHDLRGPLTAVKINAQLLARHPESLDRRSELASKINESIDRADRMIRDLLDANRIRAGQRLPLRLAACDLGEVARNVVRELASAHGERFILDAEEGVQGIWDAETLSRALWNLITNAIKYGAPNRPITIRISKSDQRAYISIHNEGTPIPQEDQAQIFEQFIRQSSAQAGDQRGWGLGLTLVRGSVEAHGGRIGVQSERSTGTTFMMDLPLDARPYQP